MSEFKNAGEEETKPGQTEVEAGSVEHQQVLKAFPNATSYGPDVNVVLPPEPPPPPPDGGAMRAPDKLPESTPKPGEPHSKPTDSKLDKKEDKK
jgi:hypothetical protein